MRPWGSCRRVGLSLPLVANNRTGTTNGPDMTFTTKTAPGHPSASVAGVSGHACVATTLSAHVTARDSSRLLRVRVTVDGRQVRVTTSSRFTARVSMAQLERRASRAARQRHRRQRRPRLSVGLVQSLRPAGHAGAPHFRGLNAHDGSRGLPGEAVVLDSAACALGS